ncbi:MAG TPA: hypothetical protein VII28_16375 [Puia sp.]
MLPVLNLLISILAVSLCFIPLGLYLWKRLAPDKPFLIISLFWMVNGFMYSPDIFTFSWYDRNLSNQVLLFYNLIDAPLIILFFYYAFKKKFFLKLLIAFIVFEIIMTLWKGFNDDSDNIIIGVGTFICLIMNIWGISQYFRNMEHSTRENILVFVNAGFIFYYGLFPVTFYFNYIRFSQATLPYITFINFFSICMATGLISFGIWKYAETQYREERY